MVKICLQDKRPEFNPCVGKIPWRRKWQPTLVFLPGKSHGWRNMIGYSPWGLEELNTTERFHFLSPGYLPNPGVKSKSLLLSLPHWQVGSSLLAPPGKPNHYTNFKKTLPRDFPGGSAAKAAHSQCR